MPNLKFSKFLSMRQKKNAYHCQQRLFPSFVSVFYGRFLNWLKKLTLFIAHGTGMRSATEIQSLSVQVQEFHGGD
jgi:hypothetical protein